MARIGQYGEKRLIFIVFPQLRAKVNEKGKREKSRMDNSKENANIYPYAYIHIHIYTKTYTYIHIIYYSSQVVLFDIIFDSI